MLEIRLLVVLSLLWSALAEISPFEESLRRSIDEVNQRRLRQNTILKEAFWFGRGNLDSAEAGLSFEKREAHKLSEFLREKVHAEISDPALRAQVKNLKNIGTFILQGEDWRVFEEIINNLKSISTAPKICPFQQFHGNCNLRYVEDVENKFRSSQNIEELKHYWLENVQKFGPQGKIWVRDYVNLYRKSAELNEAVSPSYQHYITYDTPYFLRELELVVNTIRPLYVELYAYVRELLRREYPGLVNPRGTIPYHLMEKVLMQSWLSNSVLRDPYPDRHLPDMSTNLQSQQFTGIRMFQEAERFFLSLGFPALNQTFWSQYVKQLTPEEGGPHCKNQVFDFSPDVALKYCPIPTFRTFLQAHNDMAVIHHTNARNELPLGINDEPCRGFSKAIGNAAILSVSTPAHINLIHLLPFYPADSQLSINRLFRQAMQTLFRIPLYFVFEKLFVRILDGQISPEEYNCAFWHSMDEYMGIEPPIDRSSNDFDVPYQFYESLDPKRPHAATIVSEVLGYQLYKGFCKISRQYTDYNSLQYCDFSDNHDVGNAIMRIVARGSQKSWRDFIEPITETRRLDALALMEFYQPLYNWLREHNNANNLYRGWPKTNRCFDSRWNPSQPGGVPFCVPRPFIG